MCGACYGHHVRHGAFQRSVRSHAPNIPIVAGSLPTNPRRVHERSAIDITSLRLDFTPARSSRLHGHAMDSMNIDHSVLSTSWSLGQRRAENTYSRYALPYVSLLHTGSCGPPHATRCVWS